jgi:hypothetical protein
MRFQLLLLRCEIEARRAIDPVAIKQSQGGHFLLRAYLYELLGDGRSLEKAESGTGV